MTIDEATGIWMASFNAWCEHPLPANERVAREAAATVIQQAFAERDGEDRMALQIIANPDWTWATVAEMREIARQALAAKGDGRG